MARHVANPRPQPRWEGMVYADKGWEEGMVGTVLYALEAGPPIEAEYLPVWTYPLGLRSQATVVPRSWVMYSEGGQEPDEPEGIVAVVEDMDRYRVAKARRIARQVKELLNKAHDVATSEGPLWIRLRWDDVQVIATVNWQSDALATVWIQELQQVFRESTANSQLSAEVLLAQDKRQRWVNTRLLALPEELRTGSQLKELGWDYKGLPFVAVSGSVDALPELCAGWQKIGVLQVFTATECEEMACAGF